MIRLPWHELKPLILEADEIAVDTETNAEDIRDGRGFAIGLSIAVYKAGVYFCGYYPFRHTTKDGWDYDVGTNLDTITLRDVRKVLSNFEGWVVFHNAKFDLVSLATLGIRYEGQFICTLKGCHLINENYPYSYDLTSCVRHYVGKDESKKDDKEFKTLVNLFGWGHIPIDKMEPYAEYDPVLTLALWRAIKDQFWQEITPEYWQHKQDFMRLVLIPMESRGVRVDTELCEHMTQVGEQTLESLAETLGGKPAGNYLGELILDKLKLPVVKTSPKTGKASFDKYAMEEYDVMLARSSDPTAQYITEYRGWQKSVSSNYRPYVELLSPDGRLRPNYKWHGTKTGRLSCEKPNLQQIPRATVKPWNGRMKQCFIPKDGYGLFEADYSQLELRLATAYAKEQNLLRVFAEGRDIFTEMSGPLELSRPDTKQFVYSTQYVAGVVKIARALGITPEHATRIRDNYKREYPGFTAVTQRATNLFRTKKQVRYWTKRYRHRGILDKDYKAFNSLMQGGGADIVESVMVRLAKEVDSDDCRMLLQVHDSVVWEIKENMKDHYLPKIKQIMEDIQPDFGVKFNVSIHRWGYEDELV